MLSHRVRSVLAIGSLAGSALAQPTDTQLQYEVRRYDAASNGGWSTSMDALPGDRIEVRAVVSYVGTGTVVGLGQMYFQPVVSAWTAQDVLLTNGQLGLGPSSVYPANGIGPIGGGESTPAGDVPDSAGMYGRISPFGLPANTSTSHLAGHVQTVSGATYLRIARTDVTNWFGVGPTSGPGAINNTMGNGGVNIWQGSLGSNRSPGAAPPNLNTANLVVFKFSFRLSTNPTPRDLTITTPQEGFGRDNRTEFYGQPATFWHESLESTGVGGHRSQAFSLAGNIHVVPTPAGLAVMGVGLVLAGRRRC